MFKTADMTHVLRRFITRSHRSTRLIWVSVAALSIAAATTSVMVAQGGHGYQYHLSSKSTEKTVLVSTGSLPGLSSAFIQAVNSTDVNIVPSNESTTVAEASAVSAALAEVPPGSSALAGELVILTNSQHPAGVLAWAIETTGFSSVPNIGAPPVTINRSTGKVVMRQTGVASQASPPPQNNFRVDFVDASTRAWLEGVSGYSSSL